MSDDSDDQRKLLELEQEMWHRTRRQSFIPFCIEALSARSETPALHHRMIASELQAVARGKRKRLMILAPPGSAKTTYTSRLFPDGLVEAHLEGAYLQGAHLEGVVLRWVKGLTQEQIDQAVGDAETELPEGLTRPVHWTQPERGPELAA